MRPAISASGMITLAAVVTVLVLVCMTALFSFLFWLYGKSKKRLIELGDEDTKAEKEINSSWKKFASKSSDASFSAYLQHKRKVDLIMRIVTEVLSGLVAAVLLAIAITGFVFRGQGKQFFIGNTTYILIETGSMSEKNIANAYYADLPDNQIAEHAMIGIEKVREEDLKVYDVIAFKVQNTVYVHRIVRIEVAADGTKTYTTQGDANSGSLAFEIGMPFSVIVGRYNGSQSIAMGAFMTFLQSGIGIITIVFALAVLVILDLVGMTIEKSYRTRQEIYCKKKLTEEAEKVETVQAEIYTETTHD